MAAVYDLRTAIDAEDSFQWACNINLPQFPHPKQLALLLCEDRELFYGGAAGGGKSSGVLLAGLQYACIPGYSAIVLRQTYRQLIGDDGILARAEEWLGPLGDDVCVWHAGHMQWSFKSGASLRFGHVDRDADRFKFAGHAFQYVAFDELANYASDKAFLYVGYARTRRPMTDVPLKPCPTCGRTLADVPLRLRATGNPGGPGQGWVRERYGIQLDGGCPTGRRFIAAYLHDNPSLDAGTYAPGLMKLGAVEGTRILHGDWTIRDPGQVFDRSKIEVVDTPLAEARGIERVRYWDMASTEASKANDPDWCVGTLLAFDRANGNVRVENVVALRQNPEVVEATILQTAQLDGRGVPVVIEQEPGSQGKAYIDHLRRTVLRAYRVHGDRATGPKELRIRMLIPIIDSGMCSIVRNTWNTMWLDELDAFPLVNHDDRMDSFAGAHAWLTGPKNRIIV